MAEDATLHETETKTVFMPEASIAHCHGLAKHQHDDFLQIIGEALQMAAAICADPDDVLGPDKGGPVTPETSPQSDTNRNRRTGLPV